MQLSQLYENVAPLEWWLHLLCAKKENKRHNIDLHAVACPTFFLTGRFESLSLSNCSTYSAQAITAKRINVTGKPNVTWTHPSYDKNTNGLSKHICLTTGTTNVTKFCPTTGKNINHRYNCHTRGLPHVIWFYSLTTGPCRLRFICRTTTISRIQPHLPYDRIT